MTSLDLFSEAEHEPFFWPGGQAAALLVHGFPGTPAEMRALGQALQEAGCTVQGILLPGFGPQIETLPEREYQEWIEAVREALAKLQQEYDPVLLVGYSMGGAVALNVAAQQRPSQLILLAPFWRLGTWWQRGIWHVAKFPLRFTRPLRRANFAESRLREGLNLLLPGVDLDDEAVQQELRQLRAPVKIFDQLLGVGRAAKRAAQTVDAPTLVIQGTEDLTIRPSDTRQLRQDLPHVVDYVEVEAGHALTDETGDHWPKLVQALLAFVGNSQPATK
jgi:carboxylesterase